MAVAAEGVAAAYTLAAASASARALLSSRDKKLPPTQEDTLYQQPTAARATGSTATPTAPGGATGAAPAPATASASDALQPQVPSAGLPAGPVDTQAETATTSHVAPPAAAQAAWPEPQLPAMQPNGATAHVGEESTPVELAVVETNGVAARVAAGPPPFGANFAVTPLLAQVDLFMPHLRLKSPNPAAPDDCFQWPLVQRVRWDGGLGGGGEIDSLGQGAGL